MENLSKTSNLINILYIFLFFQNAIYNKLFTKIFTSTKFLKALSNSLSALPRSMTTFACAVLDDSVDDIVRLIRINFRHVDLFSALCDTLVMSISLLSAHKQTRLFLSPSTYRAQANISLFSIPFASVEDRMLLKFLPLLDDLAETEIDDTVSCNNLRLAICLSKYSCSLCHCRNKASIYR